MVQPGLGSGLGYPKPNTLCMQNCVWQLLPPLCLAMDSSSLLELLKPCRRVQPLPLDLFWGTSCVAVAVSGSPMAYMWLGSVLLGDA